MSANGANAGALEIQFGGGAKEGSWALLEVGNMTFDTRSLSRSPGAVLSLSTRAFAERLLTVGRLLLFNFEEDCQMFVVSRLDTSKCSG